MLRVLFFARIRESLNCDSLEIPFGDQVATLNTLQERLCSEHGALWREVLGEFNLVRAVNHTVVDGDCRLQDGDEVAFFPPVTGG